MRSLPALTLLSATVLPAQTFQLATQDPGAPVHYARLALGDVTGDGHADLVCVGFLQTQLLPGSASGVFGAPTLLPGPFLGNFVRLVDSNADGQLDIWFCDQSGAARIESGTGGASVTAYLGTVRSLACADFDEDGHVDLVVGRDAGPAFVRNNGSGGYAPEVPLVAPVAMAYLACESLDVDGDGNLDFVAQRFSSSADLWRGFGDGTFQLLGALPFGQQYSVTAIADLDADGDPDLIATHPSQPPVVAWNGGGGQFTPPEPLGFQARRVAVADFDGDGILDLLGTQPTQLLLALGIGGGQFASPLSFAVDVLTEVVVGDIDADGRPEAIGVDSLQRLFVLRHVGPLPVGLTAFGPGTPGCGGPVGLGATRSPAVGALDFRVTSTNVPPDALGILAIGTPVQFVDSGLGLQVHVLGAAPLAQMVADRSGTASVAVPIPAMPQLAGATATLQAFWFGDPRLGHTCSPALFDLASSRGLSLTFQ